MSQGVRTHVALKVLNLNCRSNPLPSLQRRHLPLSTKSVASLARAVASSPSEAEMSFVETILNTLVENCRQSLDDSIRTTRVEIVEHNVEDNRGDRIESIFEAQNLVTSL